MVVRLEILFLNYTEGLFGLLGGNFNDLQEKMPHCSLNVLGAEMLEQTNMPIIKLCSNRVIKKNYKRTYFCLPLGGRFHQQIVRMHLTKSLF